MAHPDVKQKLAEQNFSITPSTPEEFSRKISFCTYPYSVLEHPIPVYITGNINNAFNCVFIPDYDIFLNRIELKL